MRILILNGPNLNLLGQREPEIYGETGFDQFFESLRSQTKSALSYYQSNVEGELINALHDAQDRFDGIVFNAGGYTHTSVAIADAVAAIKVPVIEVHISNVYARESYRHESKMAKNCIGVISGFGTKSYELALRFFEAQ
jgi:3-dehydroquinate dehydratase-2